MFKTWYPENGKFFIYPISVIYLLIAFAGLLFPIVVAFSAIAGHLFDSKASVIISFSIVFIIALMTMFWGSVLWLRNRKILLSESTILSRTPVSAAFSNFFETAAVWFGYSIGISGTVTLFVASCLFSEPEFCEFVKAFGLENLLLSKYGIQDVTGVKILAIIEFPLICTLMMSALKFFSEVLSHFSNGSQS